MSCLLLLHGRDWNRFNSCKFLSQIICDWNLFHSSYFLLLHFCDRNHFISRHHLLFHYGGGYFFLPFNFFFFMMSNNWNHFCSCFSLKLSSRDWNLHGFNDFFLLISSCWYLDLSSDRHSFHSRHLLVLNMPDWVFIMVSNFILGPHHLMLQRLLVNLLYRLMMNLLYWLLEELLSLSWSW